MVGVGAMVARYLVVYEHQLGVLQSHAGRNTTYLFCYSAAGHVCCSFLDTSVGFETWTKGWRKAVLLVALCVIPAYKIVQARQSHFALLEATMSSYFVQDEAAQRVFTDGLMQYGAAYFYRFQPTEDQYIWFAKLQGAKPKAGDYLMFVPHQLPRRFDDMQGLENFRKEVRIQGLVLDTLATEGVKLFKLQ